MMNLIFRNVLRLKLLITVKSCLKLSNFGTKEKTKMLKTTNITKVISHVRFSRHVLCKIRDEKIRPVHF